jgi:ribonuclease M5
MRRRVRETIVVEGRYDKSAVAAAVDATIVETCGFGIFNDPEKRELLRAYANSRGLILLTDCDGAGFLIRGKLTGMIGADNIKHAYIPDVYGRERRKASGSKEGKLGVEGMDAATIVAALERAGATFDDGASGGAGLPGGITTRDLYYLGLCGCRDSAARRRELQALLGLPERLSSRGLAQALSAMFTRDEFMRSAISAHPQSPCP